MCIVNSTTCRIARAFCAFFTETGLSGGTMPPQLSLSASLSLSLYISPSLSLLSTIKTHKCARRDGFISALPMECNVVASASGSFPSRSMIQLGPRPGAKPVGRHRCTSPSSAGHFHCPTENCGSCGSVCSVASGRRWRTISTPQVLDEIIFLPALIFHFIIAAKLTIVRKLIGTR